MSAHDADCINPVSEKAKNMVIIVINAGNFPLHGTKQFVRTAIKRSRGESIMRQPTIPAALHPTPMHMIKGLFGYIKSK